MKKNKILIVGERPWQILIIENALKEIFKKEPKFYLEHIDAKDALLDLCMHQDELGCIFCFHNDTTNGIEFFKKFQQSARVKSIPFVLILTEQFKNVATKVEVSRIISVKYRNGIDDLKSLGNKIVRAMVEKKKR